MDGCLEYGVGAPVCLSGLHVMMLFRFWGEYVNNNDNQKFLEDNWNGWVCGEGGRGWDGE